MRRVGVTIASAVPRPRAWRSSTSPSVCAFQLILCLAHPLAGRELLLDRLDLRFARLFCGERAPGEHQVLGEALAEDVRQALRRADRAALGLGRAEGGVRRRD